jgi:MFS family permease
MLVLGALVLPAASRPYTSEPRSTVGIYDFLPLLPFYGLVIGTFLISFFSAGTVPRLLALDGFSSPVVISHVIGASQVLLISGSFSYGWIRERIGVRRTFVLGLGLQGAGVLWIANAHGVLGIGAGTALLGLGSGIQYPNLSHLLIDHAPAGIRGRAVGLKYTAQFMGPFLATLIFVPLMNVFGIRNSMAAVGGFLAAAALATALRVSRKQVLN